MRRISTSYGLTYLGYLFLLFLLAGCSLEKKSAVNRGLQNLTAHYNILFNANELLQQKQDAYAASYIDAYNQLLSAYPDTTFQSSAADKELDAAIAKANNIISIKDQSHYIGDAYLVLGKANHLYGHYFNSVEFFRYVTLSFPQKTDLVQEARIWQTRSLLYLNQLPEAKAVLDSVIPNINPKKSTAADAYATAMQYHINTGEYADAETMAKLAVKFARNKTQRLRWTFILAQLQELNKEPQDADINYTRVLKSNASFELAFNANLNKIRLEDKQGNSSLSRMDRLRRLLRDDKNNDFIDQIYYNMALLYLADNDVDNAIKNLQLSVRKSTKNQNQKGLSYLRLADISFKNKGDFVMAKKYYDSTLLNLSPGYPDYTLIRKKSENLQILADRLQIIGHEDTLQTLAKLDEKSRTARINEMVNRHILQAQADATASTLDPFNNNYNNTLNNPNLQNRGAAPVVSTFYFYNAAAVSQGYSDFKRVWGNRKLEDNWRRSKHTSGDIAANSAAQGQLADPYLVSSQLQASASQTDTGSYRQNLMQHLPLTPQLLDESNKRIYNAYVDIGNFYRDILNDNKEAIEPFETILTRFPDDPNKAAIYYNLYRLYSDIDAAKSEMYKNLLLKNYPASIYAQVIIDPDYNKRLDDKDAEFNALYNRVYDIFAAHNYQEVIAKADSLLKLYPDHKLSAQLSYLRAISNGHQEKLAPFRDELFQITTRYPNDRLITPLINQHIIYIEANKQKMAAREFALMDNDPNEEPFIPAVVQQQRPGVQNQPVQPQQQIVKAPVKTPVVAKTPVVNPPAVLKPVAVAPPVAAKPVTPPVTTPTPAQSLVPAMPATQNTPAVATTIPATDNNVPAAIPAPVTAVTENNVTTTATTLPATESMPAPATQAPSIYSMRDSTNYYFVVNVSTGTTNLASSRFGIGQFNRTTYNGSNIKHELKNAGPNNQLIYIGRFYSLKAAKDYARAIIPLMPEIMKIPADKYMFFIITQENLDKLADKKTLDSYIDFYQKNY